MSPALADGVFTTELLEKPQHIQTIEYYPVFEKKEVHSAIFNNVDEPRGHYGKWNKPDAERILPDLTYM